MTKKRKDVAEVMNPVELSHHDDDDSNAIHISVQGKEGEYVAYVNEHLLCDAKGVTQTYSTIDMARNAAVKLAVNDARVRLALVAIAVPGQLDPRTIQPEVMRFLRDVRPGFTKDRLDELAKRNKFSVKWGENSHIGGDAHRFVLAGDFGSIPLIAVMRPKILY